MVTKAGKIKPSSRAQNLISGAAPDGYPSAKLKDRELAARRIVQKLKDEAPRSQENWDTCMKLAVIAANRQRQLGFPSVERIYRKFILEHAQ